MISTGFPLPVDLERELHRTPGIKFLNREAFGSDLSGFQGFQDKCLKELFLGIGRHIDELFGQKRGDFLSFKPLFEPD
jgi:hypothetical protein